MKRLNIPAGTHVLVGRAATPIAGPLVDSIAEMLLAIPSVTEAHLPQCFARGVIERPAQVLVLVLASHVDCDQAFNAVDCGLARILPRGTHLDVWPVDLGHELLPAVRAAGCRVV